MRFLQLQFFDKLLRPIITWPKQKKIEVAVPTPVSDDLLLNIWKALIQSYFPEDLHLHEYTVVWGRRRQKRVLASCNQRRRQVLVAQIFSRVEYQCWLEPLLYHEMCHAVLKDQVERRGRKRLWHGPSFKRLEQRHPQIPELDRWIKSGGWVEAYRQSARRK